MTETFRWRVASDNKAVHKFDVRSVRFGDGYEQRQPKSLKPKLRSWEIKIVGQKALMGKSKPFLMPGAVLSRLIGDRPTARLYWSKYRNIRKRRRVAKPTN